MKKFHAPLEIIGVNPFVFVPEAILQYLFNNSGKNIGPIPVTGLINDKPFTQTLVRYAGEWRLYINTKMLKDSPKRIGEKVVISVKFDPVSRLVPTHPRLQKALERDAHALRVFESLAPSRQLEINRYLYNLKTDEKIDQNVRRAVAYLNGKDSFAGRSNI